MSRPSKFPSVDQIGSILESIGFRRTDKPMSCDHTYNDANVTIEVTPSKRGGSARMLCRFFELETDNGGMMYRGGFAWTVAEVYELAIRWVREFHDEELVEEE